MNANDMQVGGSHYKDKQNYQHWDLVCDLELHYLIACATKYISRWRNKNGIQDLEKSVHYLVKAEENSLLLHEYTEDDQSLIERFCTQLKIEDAEILVLVLSGDYQNAIFMIQGLIDRNKSNYIKG